MRHLICVFIVLLIFLSGCDYLDTVPENDIETIETIFEKKEKVEEWLDACHLYLADVLTNFAGNPAYTGADEVVAGEYARQYFIRNGSSQEWNGLLIGDGLQMAQYPYGNVWKSDVFYAGIRYCNIFLEQIGGTYNLENWERKLWTAEIKALKAHFYFELMRHYGPIILVPENIAANSETSIMQQPRSPIDVCVEAMVTLLDEAIRDLPYMEQKAQGRRAFHNKESAATLKAQVLLYAASPLFNGNSMFTNFTNKKGEQLFPSYDKEKWKRAAEAADSAIVICLQGGKSLIDERVDKGTKLLGTMFNIENSTLAENFVNKEAIFMLHTSSLRNSIWSKWTLPYVKSSDTQYYNRDALGCIAPSMKMVEMYYTEHGLPIDADIQWDYTSRYQLGKETSPLYKNVVSLNTNTVLGLHLRREPRFYAHIAADRCHWQRGKVITDDMIVKAYRGERYGSQAAMINNSVPQNLTGYYMKKGTYSEVENNNYENVFMREEGIIIMRLAELYLMKAEAWNEYEGPLVDYSHVYEPLNTVRERAGILDVETAWLNYSKIPDKVKSQTGMREIIQREWNIEFAFEGRRFWNLRRWLKAADELNSPQYGWNILGQTAQQFYNNYEGPVVVWDKRKFVAPRDYLFPIGSEEVLISSCVQNPGW